MKLFIASTGLDFKSSIKIPERKTVFALFMYSLEIAVKMINYLDKQMAMILYQIEQPLPIIYT